MLNKSGAVLFFMILSVLLLILLLNNFNLHKRYNIYAIGNDHVILESRNSYVKLFVGHSYRERELERVLFTYVVINGSEYELGNHITFKKRINIRDF